MNFWNFWKYDDHKYDVVGEADSDKVGTSLDFWRVAGLETRTTMVPHIYTFILGCMLGISVSATILYFMLWYRYGQEYVPYDIIMTRRTYIFRPDPLYAAKPSPKTDAAWKALQPQGSGFVAVERPESYGIYRPGVPSIHPGGPERFSVAVFHQLHCLTTIREMYYTPPQEKQHGIAMATHADHCFDMLRQSLQCNADMTLEFANKERHDGKPFTVDGWGVEHKFCKDWDKVFKWASKEHRRMNST